MTVIKSDHVQDARRVIFPAIAAVHSSDAGDFQKGITHAPANGDTIGFNSLAWKNACRLTYAACESPSSLYMRSRYAVAI
ncbi:hypothetical protein IC614_05290 [Allosphingosinicella flava]|uniref:Uncharacterized protein n=1 Tax=Allosphingosinicella flava TaxID=2771430 RepID=A0A7T2GLD1_9SPHN|nr:hypothetical protein [Sphingosinicella flava]QPQ55994.1 hypothetical protein IC614_05290 [Sphingosinicella flava]